MIQKICKEKDVHCHGCPFLSDHLTSKNSRCMFIGIPEGWNIEEISDAFDDTDITDEFYKSLMNKLLNSVFKITRGDKDEK